MIPGLKLGLSGHLLRSDRLYMVPAYQFWGKGPLEKKSTLNVRYFKIIIL